MDLVGRLVTLKAIQEEDLRFLMDLFNDPRTGEAIGGWSLPISYRHQQEWYAGIGKDDSVLRFAVWENAAGQLLGSCSLSGVDRRNRTAEVHCRLTQENTAKGLGTDAVFQLLVLAFDYLDLACVAATYLPENRASNRLVTKLGFCREAALRSRIYKEGRRHDVEVWSILAEEFAKARIRYETGEL
ncbi:MAG TPA: GNAT family protein [Feifaniaceae bacterium]|nr:GNAT family protein [Feifaniaceae bacterium]